MIEVLEKILLSSAVVVIIFGIYFIANLFFRKFIFNIVTKRKETIILLIINLIKYSILIIGVFIILFVFGVNTDQVLAGAGLLGIVIGLAIQKLMQDIINGFFIIVENQYLVGEYVAINNSVGEVTTIGLKTTKILTYEGETHFISNGEIKSVINFSRNNSLLIIDLSILHKHSIEKVEEILFNVIKNFSYHSIISGPRILGVQRFDEISYTVRIICETKSYEHFEISRKLKTMFIKALQDNDIDFVNL